jgi:hypothetical protein
MVVDNIIGSLWLRRAKTPKRDEVTSRVRQPTRTFGA